MTARFRATIVVLLIPVISGCSVFGYNGCFTEHIDDAVALNEARAPFYSKQSQGRSDAISEALIRAEKRVRPYSRWLDRKARAFQREGIGIVCEEFVSMELVPQAVPRAATPTLSLADFNSFDTRDFARNIRRAYKSDGFGAIRVIANLAIEELGHEPNFHCMVRHTIESLDRVAWLAPVHMQEASDPHTQRKLRSLSWQLIEAHLLAMPTAARLDELAAPVQSDGLPILCNDLPPIHRGSDQLAPESAHIASRRLSLCGSGFSRDLRGCSWKNRD